MQKKEGDYMPFKSTKQTKPIKSIKSKPTKGTKTDGLFKSIKKESSYITGSLDKYLTELNSNDNDRAIDVNAPSTIGSCSRAIYYSRMGIKADNNFIEPRTRRIFDNGHYMHERIQKYLLDADILLMDEVPVRSDKYNIQGHTDGIISIDKNTGELGVLELKSINDDNFKDLRDAKHEHKQQGLIYAYCLEERRKYLHDNYSSSNLLTRSIKTRINYFKSLYIHLTDGNKYTKEEKLDNKINQHIKLDNLLFKCHLPITKVVIVYENKNDQNMKEFVIDMALQDNKNILHQLLIQCENVNKAVMTNQSPPREEQNKSDTVCRWCNYRVQCWG